MKIIGDGTSAGCNFGVTYSSGASKETVTVVSGEKYPNGNNTADWTLRTMTFTASSTSSTLNITSNGVAGSAVIYIDDIVITKN